MEKSKMTWTMVERERDPRNTQIQLILFVLQFSIPSVPRPFWEYSLGRFLGSSHTS